MHACNSDRERTAKIYLTAAVLGMITAYGVHLITEHFKLPLWWLDVPASVGFGWMYVALGDRWLWRSWMVRGFFDVPDLSGTYKGEGRTSFDKFEKPYELTLIIEQTWRSIYVTVITGQSKSHSSNAFIERMGKNGWKLTYVYLNQPRPEQPASMQMHYGMCTLEGEGSKPKSIEGYYYSGRERNNYGSITVTRQ